MKLSSVIKMSINVSIMYGTHAWLQKIVRFIDKALVLPIAIKVHMLQYNLK